MKKGPLLLNLTISLVHKARSIENIRFGVAELDCPAQS